MALKIKGKGRGGGGEETSLTGQGGGQPFSFNTSGEGKVSGNKVWAKTSGWWVRRKVDKDNISCLTIKAPCSCPDSELQ